MGRKIKLALCIPDETERLGLATHIPAHNPDIEILPPGGCGSFEELEAINPTVAYEIDVVFAYATALRWDKPFEESLPHLKYAKFVAIVRPRALEKREALEAFGVLLLPSPLGVGFRLDEASSIIRQAAGQAKGREERSPTELHRAAVLAVFSPTGGAGATTVAANLAVTLAKTAPGRVALLDLAEGYADQISLFPTKNPATARALADALGDLNETTLGQIMRLDPETQVRILYGARTASDSDVVTEPETAQIVKYCASLFDYVIIDLTADFNGATLAALDAATRIMLVVNPNEAGLRGARRFVDFLQRSQIPPERVFVVANQTDLRADGRAFARADEILGLPIRAHLRLDEKRVREATLKGRTFASEEHALTTELRRLALVLQNDLGRLP